MFFKLVGTIVMDPKLFKSALLQEMDPEIHHIIEAEKDRSRG